MSPAWLSTANQRGNNAACINANLHRDESDRNDRTDLPPLPDHNPIWYCQGQALGFGIRTCLSTPDRPVDGLDEFGRYDESGALKFRDQGRGDRLCREKRLELPGRGLKADAPENPKLFR
jgi:hypothetical protein